ncbi:aldose 1-epimerase [Nitrospira moscoviensis]|uniref:Putative Aldose 1-epimerase n=1 Tax=Nitrospira moscoviensis TaxID=42253 RepID=A0A0K2GJD4_NITMO|nr:hypothetical protein [Nitrospira moscoviensis]ALA60747.1 Putative Aldose 1-epimerase [Nitrospira moscoviensis]
MSPTVTPDTELTLSYERQRAVVSPWGAALRRYFVVEPHGARTDIVWGYAGAAQKKGGQGDVLIPFPGRIAGGRYTFAGRSYQLERNDKEGPNAIHGFVRTLPWRVRHAGADVAEFEVQLTAADYGPRGYPFSLNIGVRYELDGTGLSCSFAVHNVGASPAPVGVGFHPYFTVGTAAIDEAEARIPGKGYLEFNDRLTPTGTIIPAAGTEWDYREPRPVGDRRFNHCYVDLERDAQGLSRASSAIRKPAGRSRWSWTSPSPPSWSTPATPFPGRPGKPSPSNP